MFSFLKNLFGTNNNENSANENIKKTIDTESLEKEFIQLKKQLSTSNDNNICLLYTSPSPRDKRQSRMPSSA